MAQVEVSLCASAGSRGDSEEGLFGLEGETFFYFVGGVSSIWF